MTLPCIICETPLPGVDDEYVKRMTEADEIRPLPANQPYGGTAFMSHGHYGSTAFDPMDGQYIEINLCDPCLQEKAQRSFVLTGRSYRPVRVDGVIWGTQKFSSGEAPWTGNEEMENREYLDISLSEVMYYADDKNIGWNAGNRQKLQEWVDDAQLRGM